MLLEDRGDGRPCHAMTQILQRALDARVAPARILGRHPHDQAANLREHVGPSGAALRVRPFPRDELPVPAENRVGRDNRRNLRQKPTTERRAEGGQAPPFVVGEPQRWLCSCAFRTRFSSRRYSMTSCCSRWSQPMRDATSSCSGTTCSSLRHLRRATFSDAGARAWLARSTCFRDDGIVVVEMREKPTKGDDRPPRLRVSPGDLRRSPRVRRRVFPPAGRRPVRRGSVHVAISG